MQLRTLVITALCLSSQALSKKSATSPVSGLTNGKGGPLSAVPGGTAPLAAAQGVAGQAVAIRDATDLASGPLKSLTNGTKKKGGKKHNKTGGLSTGPDLIGQAIVVRDVTSAATAPVSGLAKGKGGLVKSKKKNASPLGAAQGLVGQAVAVRGLIPSLPAAAPAAPAAPSAPALPPQKANNQTVPATKHHGKHKHKKHGHHKGGHNKQKAQPQQRSEMQPKEDPTKAAKKHGYAAVHKASSKHAKGAHGKNATATMQARDFYVEAREAALHDRALNVNKRGLCHAQHHLSNKLDTTDLWSGHSSGHSHHHQTSSPYHGRKHAKNGLCWANGPWMDIHKFKKSMGWMYSWTANLPLKDGQWWLPEGIQYFPMLWGNSPDRIDNWKKYVLNDRHARQNRDKVAMGPNEVNQKGQGQMSPAEACHLFRSYIVPLKDDDGWTIIGPSTTSAPDGKVWMKKFRDTCPDVWNKIDADSVHYYGTDPNTAVEYIQDWHRTFKRDIYVSGE